MKTDHTEHTAGGFVGRRVAPGLAGETGASVRSIAIPPPGVAPSRAQRRVIEKHLRRSDVPADHRAALEAVLNGGARG